MINSNQFKKDEVWIAIRINDRFLYVNDEPYDIYILMDAMDANVFGHVLSRVSDQAPLEADVENLFRKALDSQGKWPKKLIIPDDSKAGQIFRKQAEKNALTVDTVPLSDLSPIIAPLMAAFAEEDEE
ncbi:MAG: hypothetical protein KKD44_24570 [Proteobacteria bacterium]|nr:hypothetical protein [Pseudomonadota bacterium]